MARARSMTQTKHAVSQSVWHYVRTYVASSEYTHVQTTATSLQFARFKCVHASKFHVLEHRYAVCANYYPPAADLRYMCSRLSNSRISTYVRSSYFCACMLEPLCHP